MGMLERMKSPWGPEVALRMKAELRDRRVMDAPGMGRCSESCTMPRRVAKTVARAGREAATSAARARMGKVRRVGSFAARGQWIRRLGACERPQVHVAGQVAQKGERGGIRRRTEGRVRRECRIGGGVWRTKDPG